MEPPRNRRDRALLTKESTERAAYCRANQSEKMRAQQRLKATARMPALSDRRGLPQALQQIRVNRSTIIGSTDEPSKRAGAISDIGFVEQ